jgi:UDP-glucose 4-epimerase
MTVLGDGRQAKPYIHVDDCIDGMFFGLGYSNET